MGDFSERPAAVLVAVKLPNVSDAEFASSLAELERLVSTLGYRTFATITQSRAHFESAAILGQGKLEELAALTGGTGKTGFKSDAEAPEPSAKEEFDDDDELNDEQGEDDADGEDDRGANNIELVAVDHDISPSQARNLERATGVRVLDRSGVIIEIFHRHAKSRQARLEVEIARLTYTAPRLRESPSGRERQRGRGAGEAAVELDRRKIRDRIAQLREELTTIQREQGVRRAHRQQARRLALVGYTNAGKSSLMRALTGSNVYVENKLFATLDTTVRALHPETKPRILVSDTVGFIKKLPHDLVASFKSTLDEALEASHLLHVVDASDENWRSHYDVTHQVLEEIGAGEIPTTLIFNKMDQVDDETATILTKSYPKAWRVSAYRPDDVSNLREKIIEVFEQEYEEQLFCVPYDHQRVLSEMHETGKVIEQRYENEGIWVRYQADHETMGRFRARLPNAVAPLPDELGDPTHK